MEFLRPKNNLPSLAALIAIASALSAERETRDFTLNTMV
jgi:hypothetical protein